MTRSGLSHPASPSHHHDHPATSPSSFQMIDPLSDAKIIESWHTNATPWTAAVREQRIESRKLVTDRAVVEAGMSGRPQSVLDIGCGEGWLARVLAARGVPEVVGVDVV